MKIYETQKLSINLKKTTQPNRLALCSVLLRAPTNINVTIMDFLIIKYKRFREKFVIRDIHTSYKEFHIYSYLNIE